LELLVSTHARLQAVSPVWQLAAHEPAEHTREPEQTTPQFPQLFGSALVAAQPPSQNSWLAGQRVLASAPLPPLELLPLELLEPLLPAPELPLLEPPPLELLLAPELPSTRAPLSPWVASRPPFPLPPSLPSPRPPSPGVPVGLPPLVPHATAVTIATHDAMPRPTARRPPFTLVIPPHLDLSRGT
jgi:hypothetical protein